MNSLELTDKKVQLQKQLRDMVSNAKKEVRKLNETEQTIFDALKNEITHVNEELRKIEQEKNNKKLTQSVQMEKFNLLRAIRSIANNQPMDEFALEVNKRGVEEMRSSGLSYGGQLVLPMECRADESIHVGDATYGKENVAIDKLGILEPLRKSLVMVQAGATMLNGLTGDVSIPSYSGSSVSWKGETSSAADGKGSFSEVKLSPKRLTAVIEVSKQFLAQDSNSAEAMLKADLIRAISEKLESTILGSGEGSVDEPTGLLNGVIADTAAITYKDIVSMESSLEAANVSGDIRYIVSPSAKADLKTTAKATNQGFIMDGSEMNGYPVLCTSAVAGKGVIMGNFNDFVIGQFGAIDLTVDPFTKAGDGKIRLIINAYFDAKPRRAASFAKRLLKA